MTTLIIDFNNLAMAKLYSKDVMKRKGYDVEFVDYEVWKFKMFSEIYNFYLYSGKISEIILAIDYKISWRKLYFPRYKEHRLKLKGKFNIDWFEYHSVCDEFINELKIHFPFKILQLKACEGDDIIGTLVLSNKDKKFKIISSDRDNLQLCRNGVKIVSLATRKEIKHPNPEMFLQESCLIGQPKDNIFNVVTPLDYPMELRKPPFGKKKAEKFLIKGLDTALNTNVEYKRKYINEEGHPIVYNATVNLKERYDFNRVLMDYKKIPPVLKERILNEYDNYTYPEPEDIYKFFKSYGWTYFLDNITNVENNLFELFKG